MAIKKIESLPLRESGFRLDIHVADAAAPQPKAFYAQAVAQDSAGGLSPVFGPLEITKEAKSGEEPTKIFVDVTDEERKVLLAIIERAYAALLKENGY